MKTWFENKTVALVGNAESLFHKEYGKEIDSHDCIVRLNKAAILYIKHSAYITHGTKTTHWFFFNTGEYKHRFDTIDSNVKKMHMSKLRQTKQHIDMVDHVFPVDHFLKLCEKVKYNNPTTGLMALEYIYSCNPKKLDVYGFDWKETPTFTDMDRKKDPFCHHNFDLEKTLCFEHYFEMENIEWKN